MPLQCMIRPFWEKLFWFWAAHLRRKAELQVALGERELPVTGGVQTEAEGARHPWARTAASSHNLSWL